MESNRKMETQETEEKIKNYRMESSVFKFFYFLLGPGAVGNSVDHSFQFSIQIFDVFSFQLNFGF